LKNLREKQKIEGFIGMKLVWAYMEKEMNVPKQAVIQPDLRF
jgi:hypothetical protein